MMRIPSAVDIKINDDPIALHKLEYPLFASLKIDGIRAYSDRYTLYSKSNKPIRNFATQEALNLIDGIDGELVVGEPNAIGCINRTYSGVMSYENDPEARIFVFDYFHGHNSAYAYHLRLDSLKEACARCKSDRIVLLEQQLVRSVEDVLEFEKKALSSGYEGVILRSPHGLYVSAPREARIYKLKRFCDTEVTVVGFVEMLVNNNPQKVSELGTMVRSKDRSMLTPGGTLGGFVVMWNGGEIVVGCGRLTEKERLHIFQNQADYLGRRFTMRYMRYGMLDDSSPPRMAVFHTWREIGI